ncbi:hypothetical protein A9Q84_04235 [Halobacteriovorax marinus]|uniref:Uncharacterized protein n=1 Tax=Halobacteriovorax marinus TaxID=97084 RepID=A0A1Y5FFZ8_9BACT|nr:hypothetical protein A9Q84_04235 [Halobacteriovorax marinus]
MDKTLYQDFVHGIQTLEDIQALGDIHLTPLIDRATFHIGEIHRKAELSLSNLDEYAKVKTFLETTVDQLLTNYTLKDFGSHQVLFQKKFDSMSLKDWDKLLSVLPISLHIVSIFKFIGTQNIQLSSEGITFRGLIKTDQNITKYRELVYKATRKLLSHQSILTYKIDVLDDERMCWLELKIDTSHDENLSYCLDYRKKLGTWLGFSNIFEKYIIPHEQVKDLPRHLVIEINNELEVKTFYRVPDSYTKRFKDKEILHFSFLFRPISIIIPRKGCIINKATLRKIRDTGSGLEQQEVENRLKYLFRYIDFFSLINQS